MYTDHSTLFKTETKLNSKLCFSKSMELLLNATRGVNILKFLWLVYKLNGDLNFSCPVFIFDLSSLKDLEDFNLSQNNFS